MQKFLWGFLILSIFLNSKELTANIIKHQTQSNAFKLHQLGDQFKGLESILKGQRTVGYYTDKNTDEALVIAQFEQAQYHLAPTVLDLNNTSYPFVILDCSSPEVAIKKVTELNLKPLKVSSLGVILAINTKITGRQP